MTLSSLVWTYSNLLLVYKTGINFFYKILNFLTRVGELCKFLDQLPRSTYLDRNSHNSISLDLTRRRDSHWEASPSAAGGETHVQSHCFTDESVHTRALHLSYDNFIITGTGMPMIGKKMSTYSYCLWGF